MTKLNSVRLEADERKQMKSMVLCKKLFFPYAVLSRSQAEVTKETTFPFDVPLVPGYIVEAGCDKQRVT